MATLIQVVVEKLKHNYVRFAALQSQLLVEPQSSTQPGAHSQPQSALKHFVGCTSQGKQYLNRITQQRSFANGKYKNGVHTAPEPPSSAFLRQLQQEVERLRRFVHSFAEDLWMRLLDTADSLCLLKQCASSLDSRSEQKKQERQHQDLMEQCDCIGGCEFNRSLKALCHDSMLAML